MAKKVSFGRVGMDKQMVGLDIVCEAVGSTIGPKGLNASIANSMGGAITNDGFTIAQQISLEDPEEERGAYIVKNVSSQQNDNVGDGTTTVTILLQSIIHECLKRPENPMEIKDSLKEVGEKVLKLLAKKSIKITKNDIEKVALISSENKELAKYISQIINKLGEKAIINVEDSRTFGTEIEYVDGYEAAVGFVSPHFITDKKTARAIYTDIPVFVSEKKISNIGDITPLFKQFEKEGISSCVIVCEEIDDSILGILVANRMMGKFNSLVIRASGPLLQDIESAVGATMVTDNTGVTFQNITLDHLGKAKKIICDANRTVFIGNSVTAKLHAQNLEKMAETEPNQYTAKKLMERVAKLMGGVAVLKIGAPTDFERDYLRLKAEDAVKAARAALEEGVVEGGGMTLYRIAQELKGKTLGEQILKRALVAPLRKIITNAGKDYSDIINNLPENKGYDAKLDKYVPMIEVGIIDPTKVERCAIENAISAASTFITTYTLITDIPEKKNA